MLLEALRGIVAQQVILAPRTPHSLSVDLESSSVSVSSLACCCCAQEAADNDPSGVLGSPVSRSTQSWLLRAFWDNPMGLSISFSPSNKYVNEKNFTKKSLEKAVDTQSLRCLVTMSLYWALWPQVGIPGVNHTATDPFCSL